MLNSLKNDQPSVALVYDRVNSWGGAERVLLQLHRLYPQAPLFTSVYDPKTASWAQDWDVRTSWLQKIPWLRNRHRYLGWLMPAIFESLSLAEFDLVISVSSEAAKGVITQPNQLHICYLLTPTRYLWSHQETYLQQIPTFLHQSAKKVMSFLQKWDLLLASRPDVIIPISKRVKQRAENFYHREVAEPLYPAATELPVAQQPKIIPKNSFFFAWGRHVAYKHFEIIIQAAALLCYPLVVAGEGPQTKRLKKIARTLDPLGQFIFFVGQISDAEIVWYLQHTQAAVIPQEEDFGLTILEAVSQGCPVIVHAESGAAECLRPEKDGLFLPSTDVSTLQTALKQAMVHPWNNLDIRRQARQYAEVVWQTSFLKNTKDLWQQQQIKMKGMHE
jgi:glycosyltransferase involved in cell wall biosynthesis